MILETLYQVRQLSIEEKRKLAEELWDEVLPRAPLTPSDDALERLLDLRNTAYQANPASAETWEIVRARLNAARKCVKP